MNTISSVTEPIALQALVAKLQRLAFDVLARHAEAIDRDGSWPEASMHALGESGFLGLHVPARLGGQGQGLAALARCTEIIAQVCPSTAMCFGMHCVGTAVIAAKATKDHDERYLRPIAQGRHITTLSLSETATGAHFYFPQTQLTRVGDTFRITGTKQFVTNGGHADSYVVTTQASSGVPGEFSCLIADKDAGIRWLEPWQGFGMRGNSSRGMCLDRAVVPVSNLLGAEGDQVWYVFEVVAPYFILAMAGTYLGIASSALDIAINHLRERVQISGETLAGQPILQHRVGELWTEVQRTRGLVLMAAQAGDAGDANALPLILAAKVAAAESAVLIANEAMTLCGGIAYRENDRLTRLLRDARAGPVMSPTSDLLKLWTGRTLLGQPLL